MNISKNVFTLAINIILAKFTDFASQIDNKYTEIIWQNSQIKPNRLPILINMQFHYRCKNDNIYRSLNMKYHRLFSNESLYIYMQIYANI